MQAPGGRQDGIAQRDADAPEEHGAPCADEPIGDPAAGQRGEINPAVYKP